MKLDSEEKELLASIENGDWQPISDSDKYKLAAEEHFKKNKRISFRISEFDLKAIQKKAAQVGIPYQTLITSLIHQYVNGSLVENKT